MRWTAGQIIDRYLQPVPSCGATVDGILAGSPDTVVTGIATTFLASQAVLERAAALGANMVISHEGIYYSHDSNTEPFAGNSAYETKKRWLEDFGFVVYRYHDRIHRIQPDGITAGFVEALGWRDYVEENRPEASVLRIPTVELHGLIAALKEKLGLPYVRFVGDLTAPCSGVGVTVGYRGGGAIAIPLFEDDDLDVVIAGEGPEWETPEYVCDAMHQGKRKALILVGHAASEEPGMRRLAKRLQAYGPGVPIHFISDRQAIHIL